MLNPQAARDQAVALVELARRKGADAADAVYVGERSSPMDRHASSSPAAEARRRWPRPS